MSDMIPVELEEMLSEELMTRGPFSLHFEYPNSVLKVTVHRAALHCATCQCNRAIDPVMPLDSKGNPRKRSWHHD